MFSDNLERFYRQFWGVVVTGLEISISVDGSRGGRQGDSSVAGSVLGKETVRNCQIKGTRR